MKNKNQKKKILFIIPYLLGGGALKTVGNLSREFSKRYDITIVGIYKSEKKFNFTGRLIELNMEHQRNPLKKLRDFFKVKKMVTKIKKNGNYDYSISFLVIADFINVLTKNKKQNEKTLVSIRNMESIEYKDKPLRRMQEKYALKKCDYIVSISKEVENDLIENFGVKKEKVETIYNPCIVDEVDTAIDDSMIKKGQTVITVGGLKNQKGQWHLIRAFSRVTKELPDAKLLVFGRGPLEEYLRRLIKEYNLERNVQLMGYVIGPYEYVKKSDIFVFPSLFEGLGNALMEALKCETPIISTDYSSGAREILAPKTSFNDKTQTIDYAEYGVLVPCFDEKKYESTDPLTTEEKLMAEAIISMIKDRKLREKYSANSKKRSQDFEISNIADNWYALFERLEA